MDIRTCGTQFEKLRILFHRFLEQAAGEANITQPQTGFGAGRIKLDRPFVGYDRLIDLRFFFVQDSQIEVYVAVGAVAMCRLPIGLDGLHILAGCLIDVTELFV